MAVLTKIPIDPLLDLDPWVGQRQATFRFMLSNAVTGEELGEIHPIRNDATLTHDTQRTIKRQLQLSMGVADTAAINAVTDRITPFMVFPNGASYPLGRYQFTNQSNILYSGQQRLGTYILSDEMFTVDQQILKGVNGVGKNVAFLIAQVLEGLNVTYDIEATSFNSAEAWSIGANRGQILEALAVSGDYFSPWFGNDTKMHFIRTFNPAAEICDFDFDAGNKVMRENIIENSDLLTAPNLFVVLSNNPQDTQVEVAATAEIPSNAPNSIINRGFAITKTETLQISTNQQAAAIAQGLAQRQTIFEKVELTTAPDPRHDSYDVIRWQGANWLELSWSLALVEGGRMNHLLRKAYL